MSQVLDKIREKYPQYKDIEDDVLAEKIGSNYPRYLERDADFKTEYDNAVRKSLGDPGYPVPHDSMELAAQNFARRQQLAGGKTPAPEGIGIEEPIDIGGTIFRQSIGDILPSVKTPEEAGLTEKIAAGIYNPVASVANFALSPSGIATALAPEVMGAKIAGPILKGTFLGLLSKALGEKAGEASVTKDPQDITEAGMTSILLGAAGLAKNPLSEKEEPNAHPIESSIPILRSKPPEVAPLAAGSPEEIQKPADLQKQKEAEIAPAEAGKTAPQSAELQKATPKLTFEEFSKQYQNAFDQSMKYSPDEVGSQVWMEKMAALSDAYPQWAKQTEEADQPSSVIPSAEPTTAPKSIDDLNAEMMESLDQVNSLFAKGKAAKKALDEFEGDTKGHRRLVQNLTDLSKQLANALSSSTEKMRLWNEAKEAAQPPAVSAQAATEQSLSPETVSAVEAKPPVVAPAGAPSALPETTPKAETEQTGVSAPEAKKAGFQTERPHDLIDEVEGRFGKISISQAKKINPNFKPIGAARKLFSKDGMGPDLAMQSVEGFKQFESQDHFLDSLNEAANARKAWRTGLGQEAKTIKIEEAQTNAFIKDTKHLGPNSDRVVPEDLFPGDEFTVFGHKVKVKEFEFDHNGDIAAVILDDGNRYGTQRVNNETRIHIDHKSLKRAPGATFEPEAEAPKLRPGEKKTGDLFQGQDAPFNLAGQSGIDTGKLAEEKAQAERQQQEAKALAEKHQPALPSSGDVQMTIVPGAKEFIEKDVIPALEKTGQTLKESGQQVKALLSPPSMGEGARLASGIVREHAAELAQKDKQAREQFAKAKREMDYLTPAQSLAFIDRMEKGQVQPSSGWNTLQTALRTAFDQRVAQVRALGTGKLEHVIQNYFPHIWKDPDAAVSWYARILGKRPLRGPASFLKRRSIPLTSDGVAAGLEPVTWNPVELSLLKLHEIDRYVMGQKIFTEFKDKGLAEFSRSDIPPAGKARINDRIANVIQYRPTTTAAGAPGAPERILRGHWYVQEDAARILNNFLSPGLERFKWFRALRWVGNTMNMAQLGLSGYHFTFTMIDSGTSKLSLGIEQAAQGKAKSIATMARGLGGTVLANQIEYFYKGSKVLQEYTKPGSVGGDYAKVVDGLLAGGGRTEMPKIFKNSSLENFFTAIRGGNYPGAVMRAPFAAIEAVSYPLMQVIVPRLKLGAFAEMALHDIDRLGPTATREQFREAMGKIWDSVDNRMGELVYDNLFWNRTLKDLSFLGVRAVGWNLGTVRELGGGVLDSATLIKRLRQGEPIVTKRMAYLMALPMTVGMMGALYQYAHTGKGPEELRDYFYPKTGKMLPDGTPERVNFPSYLKDIASYGRHPLTTIGHKLHPLWATITDMVQNKDYYGTQIRNPDDPLIKQLGEDAAFVGKQFVPFSVKGLQRRVGAEQPATKTESFFGVMPIPPEIARTTAQNKIMEYGLRKMSQGPRTQEEQMRHELRQDIENQIQSPSDYAKARQKLVELQRSGEFTRSQRLYEQSKLRFERLQMAQGKTKSEAQWLWRYKHLDVTEAQSVYDSATPAEQKLLARDLALKKRHHH